MILKICIFLIQLNMMRGEHPLLSAMKHAKYGPFGLVGLKERLNGSLDYIENVLGHRIKFNESIHSFNNISYKYLTECDVKPLNKFLFTTTNFYDHNTYRWVTDVRLHHSHTLQHAFKSKLAYNHLYLNVKNWRKITSFINHREGEDTIRRIFILLNNWWRMLFQKVTWQ